MKLQNVDFAGKTGTAQIESFDLQNKLGKKLKENGWFVGYAPRRNPEIVVAALVQGGGWGSTSAAPVVRDVVKAYYDKKNGNFHRALPLQIKTVATRNVHASYRFRGSAASMKDRARIQDFDWPLLAIVGAISLIGVLEIYSSTHASAMNGMQWKQLIWIAAGVAGMFLISRIDYHTLLNQAPAFYLFGVASLLVVLVMGFSRLGAKRWISIGGIANLQVSELMKLIIIIVLARYFSEVRTDRLTLADLVKVGILTLVPVGLILKQPDLGHCHGAGPGSAGRRLPRRY